MENLTPNLMVADVKATAQFYEQVFGFQILTTVPDMQEPESGKLQFALLKCGGVNIMFQNQPTLVEDVPDFAHQKIGGTFTLYINVEDVHSLFDKIKAHITVLKGGLYETFYNTIEFTMRDPNGYFLTFAQENS